MRIFEAQVRKILDWNQKLFFSICKGNKKSQITIIPSIIVPKLTKTAKT